MNNSGHIANDKMKGPAAQGNEPIHGKKESTVRHESLRRLFSWKVMIGVVLFLDFLGISASLILSDIFFEPVRKENGSMAILSILFLGNYNLALFYFAGFYNMKTLVTWPSETRKYSLIAIVILLPALLLDTCCSEPYDGFPRWLLAVGLTSYVLIWLLRSLFFSVMCYGLRKGWLGQNIAVIGYGETARGFISSLDDYVPSSWWNIIGVFDDRRSRVSTTLEGVPLLGRTEDVIRYAREGKIQQVVIALPWNAKDRLNDLRTKLGDLPVMLSLAYDPASVGGPPRQQEFQTHTPTLDINHLPSFGWAGIIKWIEDKILSIILLMIFLPVFAIISILIKLDSPGPVFFRQARHGFNNKRISIYKFRTMYHSDQRKDVFRQAERGDSRVTRIGRILRKTSLDELPQLFNVLAGSMSLVGPRPHPIELNDKFVARVAGIEGRHNVKPGITGWAQINGLRGETKTPGKMAARVEYDIAYIEHWSLWLDLKILFLTAFRGWMHDNAY